eukprot:gene13050-13177_t
MKFRASLTEKGSRSLATAFLPTLEKFGKTCQVLLGPEEINFVQTPLEADGANVSVRFAVSALFNSEGYKVQSRHFNLIAFAVDVGLLLKALRSAISNEAHTLEVKLTQKPVPLPGQTELENKPFLCFTARGTALSLVQDLPISKPCTPSEIDQLAAAKEVATLCPFYLDLKSADARKEADPASRQLSAEQQLQDALDEGDAMAVHIQVKQLLKVIDVSKMSRPEQILLGIGEGCGHVHVMYVYRDPFADRPYDDSMAVNFKLPVRDED